jgi:hypothetical protein
MRQITLRQPIATTTLFVGWLHAIECDPTGWDFPASTAAYLRLRIADLAADLLSTERGTAVAA